jgi:hypothetical protein
MFSSSFRLSHISIPPAALSLRTRVAQAAFRLSPWTNNSRKMATATEFKQVRSCACPDRCSLLTIHALVGTSQVRIRHSRISCSPSLTIGQTARHTGPDRSSRRSARHYPLALGIRIIHSFHCSLYANAHPSMSHVGADFVPVLGDCIRMFR